MRVRSVAEVSRAVMTEELRAARRCSDCKHFTTHNLPWEIRCLKGHYRYVEPCPTALRVRLRTAATCDDFEAVREEG